MKRLLFYLVILLQLFVLLFLIFQFEKIDQTGHEVKIQTLSSDFPVYDDFIRSDLYVDYDINKIASDKWNDSLPSDYNSRVYVLLQKDKMNVYRTREASADKLEAKGEDEAVLVGTYQYYDVDRDVYYVNYGFEKIKGVDQFGRFKQTDQLIVTLLIGKWGQYKVINIEKWNE